MSQKKKRRLTEDEIEEIQDWMASAPQHSKPTIRQIARRYGVNQPSVIKSLGAWEGVKRNRPAPVPRSTVQLERNVTSPVKIEPFTSQVPDDLKQGANE